MPESSLIQGRPHEECGVCAVSGHGEAAKLTYLGLQALQHRGQETSGIVSAHLNSRHRPHHRVHRGMGRVAEVFSRDDLEALHGRVAIGHVRYSTTGAPRPFNTQPLVSSLRHGPVALAHNGNLTNAHILRRALKAGGAIFQTTVDSEVILHLLSRVEHDSFEDCLRQTLSQIQGAYSLVLLHGQCLYAVRDPRGFRPLALGRLPGGAWTVASESVAFDLIDAALVRDIAPGEMVCIEPGCEPVSSFPLPAAEPSRCIFELIYFSRPDSVVDGHSVQSVRVRLGEALWREHPAEGDVVICVPDSSTAAAIGYARAGGIAFDMGLIRSHYIGRTFIEPLQRIRDFGAKLKYNPVRGVVEGKRVVVVDDSIVRGTTSRKIVRMLRQAGATAIHMRVTAPPWRHPCPYGIDTPDPNELIASSATVERIRDQIEADSLGYLSTDGLREATGQADGWCMACFTGEYPVPPTRGITKEVLENDDSVSSTMSMGNGMQRSGLEERFG
ncbi:amidophosphoribosyltransferase [Candidatus Sumerlaeota bacterium]|nr:amidophosphoribosyltransferase [Candidatus Sumerlaeota bacterium]